MKTLLAFMLPAFAMLTALCHAQAVSICDRTPQVRDEIMLAIDANDCAAVRVRQLAAVDGLCFGQSNYPSCRSSYDRDPIAALKPGDFDGLTRLDSLNLGDNQLTTLPSGAFDRLTNLRNLDLHGNLLTTLPAGVFDRLTRLLALRLHDNRLTTLPAGAFDRLTRLLELRLDNNRLTTLPSGAFDGLTGLLFLLLGNNRLASLPAGAFDKLTNLRILELQNNHLLGLTRNDPLFAELPSDVDLDLSGQTEAPEPPELLMANATRPGAAKPWFAIGKDFLCQVAGRIAKLTSPSLQFAATNGH